MLVIQLSVSRNCYWYCSLYTLAHRVKVILVFVPHSFLNYISHTTFTNFVIQKNQSPLTIQVGRRHHETDKSHLDQVYHAKKKIRQINLASYGWCTEQGRLKYKAKLSQYNRTQRRDAELQKHPSTLTDNLKKYS